MVEATTVSIAIACASVVAGITYYTLQVRNLVKSRQMDVMMRLYLTWGSDDMKRSLGRVLGLDPKDYATFSKEHGSIASANRSPIWLDIDKVGWFLNGLGFMVHRRFVSIGMIDEMFGYGIRDLWVKKFKPLVIGWRSELNWQESFRWFEYLADELERERGRTSLLSERSQ